jgi:hypothetical protein
MRSLPVAEPYRQQSRRAIRTDALSVSVVPRPLAGCILASMAKPLAVGDGGLWIDLDECEAIGTRSGMLYKTKKGSWILQPNGDSPGIDYKSTDAFKLLMQSGKYAEAEKNFPDDFEQSKL